MSVSSPQQLDPLRRAEEVALRYLTLQPRSEAELIRGLGRRFSQAVTRQVMDHLQHQGLVDDRAFAHFWVDRQQRNRPRSAALIRAELMGKGIAREMAEEAVAGLDDKATALRLAIRHAQGLGPVDYHTLRRKVGPYLARRGFGEATVRHTLRRLLAEGDRAGSENAEL